MKRIFRFVLITLLVFSVTLGSLSETSVSADDKKTSDWPEGPKVFATTAVLIDASTGTVLYDKKCHKKMYPASITKIMTALLTIENCNLNDTVTFSDKAVNSLNYFEDANIGCQVGEKMKVKDCLYALMLSSANEVATALGEHVGGDVKKFAEMMNARAREAGANDAHFANANGLHDENHYVTAYDMAMITRAAASHEVFNEIVNTVTYTIPKNNKRKQIFSSQQRHKMVSPYNAVYYDGIIGGKTGYTDQAGTTLVTYAKRKGMTLICVVLHSNGENVYKDTKLLLDYGFDNFEKMDISKVDSSFSNQKETLASPFNNQVSSIEADSNATLIVPKGVKYSDLSRKVTFKQEKDSFAQIDYSYLNHTVGSAKLSFKVTKAETKPAASKQSTTESETTTKPSPKKSFKIPKYMISLLIVLLILIGILTLLLLQKRKMNRIRAQKRQRNR